VSLIALSLYQGQGLVSTSHLDWEGKVQGPSWATLPVRGHRGRLGGVRVTSNGEEPCLGKMSREGVGACHLMLVMVSGGVLGPRAAYGACSQCRSASTRYCVDSAVEEGAGGRSSSLARQGSAWSFEGLRRGTKRETEG
jgi:hypothetical protein